MKILFLSFFGLVTACGAIHSASSTSARDPIFIKGPSAEVLMGILEDMGARPRPGINGEFIKVEDLKAEVKPGLPGDSGAIFVDSYQIGLRKPRRATGAIVLKLVDTLEKSGIKIRKGDAGSVALDQVACEMRWPSPDVYHCTIQLAKI